MVRKTKPQWIKFFSRGQHPGLVNDIAWQSLVIQPKVTGLPKPNFYKRDTKSTYFDQDEYSKLLRILESQLKNSPTKLLRQLKKTEEIYHSILRLAKQYNGYNWQKISDGRLKSRLILFLNRFLPLFCFIYYPLWLEEAGTELLRKLLKTIELKKREEIIWQITRPDKLTTREKFQLALLQAACQIRKSGEKLSFKKINKLIKDFGYLPTYILNIRLYTPAEMKEEIKYLLTKDPCQKRKEKLQLLRKKEKERQTILKNFSPEIQKIAAVLSYDVWLRDERVAWYGKIFTLVQPLFREAAKRQGVTYQEFIQQRILEIKANNISRQELQARLKGYTYLVEEGRVTVFPCQQRDTLTKKQEIIKGRVANPGRAWGRVRTGTAYTFHQIQPGEVVVSGMTTPEATTFLRRAAAIVTDEGGIACHAAIIARELNIPCVIGTKFATQVFKDGDKIEVDAEKGIVRKIK